MTAPTVDPRTLCQVCGKERGTALWAWPKRNPVVLGENCKAVVASAVAKQPNRDWNSWLAEHRS